jgi:hypothetical protein
MNNGNQMEKFFINFLSSYLVTTKWIPKLDAFQALHGTGTVVAQQQLSHGILDVEKYYYDNNNDSSKTPLVWSAGLIVHPKISVRTQRYMKRYGLTNNVHLWPITKILFTEKLLHNTMSNHSHFSLGQCYLDIRLTVFKLPKLVLSSFELYNPHVCGFQQSPWMANIGGVPVWSRSGLGSESIAGFGINNTHNPAVQQIADVLVASYVTPSALNGITGAIFRPRVYLMWPAQLFEVNKYCVLNNSFEDSTSTVSSELRRLRARQRSPLLLTNVVNLFRNKETDDQLLMNCSLKLWRIGVRNDCYVACHLTTPCYVNVSNCNDLIFQVDVGSDRIPFEQIWTDSAAVSIVIVVGSKQDFPTIENFVDCRLRFINVNSLTIGSSHNIEVRFPQNIKGDSNLCKTIKYKS